MAARPCRCNSYRAYQVMEQECNAVMKGDKLRFLGGVCVVTRVLMDENGVKTIEMADTNSIKTLKSNIGNKLQFTKYKKLPTPS